MGDNKFPKIITSLFLIAKTKASRLINFTFSPPIIEFLFRYSNSRSLFCFSIPIQQLSIRNITATQFSIWNPFTFIFTGIRQISAGKSENYTFGDLVHNHCCHSPISRFRMVLETKFGNMWHLPDWFFRGWGLSVDHRRRLQRGYKGCKGIVCNSGMSHHCTRWLAWHSYYWSDAAVLLSNAFALVRRRRVETRKSPTRRLQIAFGYSCAQNEFFLNNF